MPSVTGESATCSTLGTVVSVNTPHGQTPGAVSGLADVKLHVPPDDSTTLFASFAVSVTEYFTKPLSADVGVKVAVRVEETYETEPGTVLP